MTISIEWESLYLLFSQQVLNLTTLYILLILSREAKFIIDKKLKAKKLHVEQQKIYTLSKLSLHKCQCGEEELFSLKRPC